METQNNLAQRYFDQADAFMIAINSDEVVTDINKKGCEILGHPKNKIIGKNWFDNFLPKEQRETVRKLFHEMLNGSLRHMHYKHSVVFKNETERTFDWHNIMASNKKGKTIGVLSSGADITERRAAEKTAKKLENRLQISLDNMIEGYQIIDYDYRYVYINESAAKQGRQSKEELLGCTMMQAYPSIERTEMFSHLRNCMTNRVPHEMENEFTFPDGSKGWFELHIEPVPEGVLVLSLDITKNKRNEAELNKYRHRLEQVIAERTAEFIKANEKLTREIHEHRRSVEGLKLRAMILDNAREAIFLVNAKGDFVYANDAACKAYGYTLDEFLSLNLRQLLSPDEAPIVESRLKEVIEKGQLQFETVHMRKDKSPMHVQVRHSPIKTLHGQFIVSVVRDIA